MTTTTVVAEMVDTASLKPWPQNPRKNDGAVVRVADSLDERQAHLLALADNRLGEFAEWDTPELHAQLAEYSSDEALLAGWDDAALVALATEDPAPVKPVKKVKTEDNHCPYCGRYMSDKLMAAHAKREGQSSR
jgi:hypothetical protein